MKTRKNIIREESSKNRIKGDGPFIFSIPRPYEDAFVKRDKDMYVKVQRLQQTYQALRQQLLEYAERHERQYQETKKAINLSLSLVNRYIARKQKENDELYG